MPFGNIAGALASGLASSGASFGLSKLFGGGGSKGSSYASEPKHLRTSGFAVTHSPAKENTTFASTTPERQALLDRVGLLFKDQSSEFGSLRSKVQPGFGALTEARLSEIENARRRNVGNIRDALQRRRIFGSSFAQDAVSRAEAEFGQKAGEARAVSFLEELQLTSDLLGQEFAAARDEFNVQLQNQEFEAKLAANFAGQANQASSGLAGLQSELLARSSQLAGQFYGQTTKPLVESIGEAASLFTKKLFGGGSSGAVIGGGQPFGGGVGGT